MTTFGVHTAKTNLSRLIEQALCGEEVIIARGDKPVVRQVPAEASAPRRRFGWLNRKLKAPTASLTSCPKRS